jgi:hypothetical protein
MRPLTAISMIAESVGAQTSEGAATIQFRHNGRRLPEVVRKRCANIAPVIVFL